MSSITCQTCPPPRQSHLLSIRQSMNVDQKSKREEIESRIPHRPPMLLIDEIVEEMEDSITCRKTFRPDEFFVQGHYPDFPIVPGVILTECGAQTGAVLLSKKVTGTEGVPVLTKLESVRFKNMIRPGQTIEINVQLDDQVSSAFYLTARISCEGKMAVRFSFVCSLVPAHQ